MEARMTRTGSRYERLDAIERTLARQPEGLSTSDLAREFGVDADTIRRDLLLIEGRGTGLIKHGRRYLLDHRRSFHSVKLNNDEALALYLAARLLSRHSDEHNPHVVKALEKLADALVGKSPLIAGHIARAADAVRARRVRREYVEALEVLTQGWASGRKVRLRYRSYTKDENHRAHLCAVLHRAIGDRLRRFAREPAHAESRACACGSADRRVLCAA
jgi:predicted DNA-binding transcriptional regulator YafY